MHNLFTKIKLKKRIKPTLGKIQGWKDSDAIKYGDKVLIFCVVPEGRAAI